VDRILSLTLFALALTCVCGAALLALAGFIDWLVSGRWPDQSVLRLAYDNRLLHARWFLQNDWSMPVRDVLARVPAAAAALGVAPLCWWLGSLFARR
jgi:hypothetical protein